MQERSVLEDWPQADLENVGRCPLCFDEPRSLLYSELRDRLFGAPGTWTLYRCSGCGAGYLDPRPSRSSLALAYRSYFTHTEGGDAASSIERNQHKRAAENWYLNYRWQTRLPASSAWRGAWYALTHANWRRQCERTMRHLPQPARGKLLDAGCGNGDFLSLAQQSGWQVEGFDFDPEAVSVARQRGLPVKLGGIDTMHGREAEFDAITLSHVIEHVHDPAELLKRCRELLKPGGFFWIETPNLDAVGRRMFKHDWRGLEPPRHLVLFNLSNLRQQLAAAGFENIRQRRWAPTFRWLYDESRKLRDPHSGALTRRERILCRWIERYEKLARNHREILTLTASAPHSGA